MAVNTVTIMTFMIHSLSATIFIVSIVCCSSECSNSSTSTEGQCPQVNLYQHQGHLQGCGVVPEDD